MFLAHFGQHSRKQSPANSPASSGPAYRSVNLPAAAKSLQIINEFDRERRFLLIVRLTERTTGRWMGETLSVCRAPGTHCRETWRISFQRCCPLSLFLSLKCSPKSDLPQCNYNNSNYFQPTTNRLMVWNWLKQQTVDYFRTVWIWNRTNIFK